MQTFLPVDNFEQSARYLDKRRRGKQRVEGLQIINSLRSGPGAAWYNHPATRMWKGYEDCLFKYVGTIIKIWKLNGCKDTIWGKLDSMWSGPLTFPQLVDYPQDELSKIISVPFWLGDEEFHRSHRSNLLRKNKEHYSQYFNEVNYLPYKWPV